MTKQQEEFLQSLIREHTLTVGKCIAAADNTAKVVPTSVHNYSEMFLNKLLLIVKEMK